MMLMCIRLYINCQGREDLTKLAWIGHRNKQYHLIYSSQPGLWSSVLNRGLPSTQCIHMANTVLVEWSNFTVGQSCLFSNCMTWAIWVWSRKNTLCVINVLIMPILIDVKCSQSCYIHFLHTLSTITLFYAVSWNLNFKALYVCCRGEFFDIPEILLVFGNPSGG